MKKGLLSISLVSAVVVAGCSADSSLISALNQFGNILEGATPYIQESEEWEQYSIEKTAKGVVYGSVTKADEQFVSKKMDSEYPAAIDRLSRPFALNKETVKELDAVNKGYHFTYHQIMSVKDKSTSNIIGYCVNFDVNRWENGKPTSWDTAGNSQKSFIYVDKKRTLSISTVSSDFIKRMCGNDFYNKYKNPKA